MPAALKAGTAYFAVVYAIGFVLGAVRVLLLLPLVGETAAILFEAPLMLLASWITARWASKHFAVRTAWRPRLVMGGFAFALLMLGELAVSNLIFGRPWEGTIAAYLSAPGLIGFFAQLMFAALPLVQAILSRRHAAAA